MTMMRHKQSGFTLFKTLVLTLSIVGLVVLSHKDKLPRVGNFNNLIQAVKLKINHHAANSDSSLSGPSTFKASSNRFAFEDNLMESKTSSYRNPKVNSGIYSVQVFAGYNSQSAFDIRRRLTGQGYPVKIYQTESDRGILFQVVVGQYNSMGEANAVKSYLHRMYSDLKGSFVVELGS